MKKWSKRNKEYTATLGLLLITVWAALQYVFLQNVPSSVSTFSFIFITNLVGLPILAVAQRKKLKMLKGKVLPKGALLAGELVGFNFFMIIGSRGMDSVIISSIISMYFVFVTPLLLLLKKKVSFRSAVASAVAIIALLLMFNADIGLLFRSVSVVFLLIADLFFAAYVITVSMAGADEDSSVLTISQMIFSILFSLCGWGIETIIGNGSFSFPRDKAFWITVVFFGVWIRALYSLIQINCQKYVKPVNASLIFSSEIIITLITNPFMSKLMHTEYTPATMFQVIGCILFVIAVIVVDDTVMRGIGYTDMAVKVYVDENGVTRTQSTVSRKLTNMTLVISMAALVISTVICITAISSIKNTAVGQSTQLGHTAADVSEDALKAELEKELINTVTDKAMLAEEKLMGYVVSAQYAADTVQALYDRPSDFPEKEVMYPLSENAGIWTMQRVIADADIPYAQLEEENLLLGNLENIFATIVNHSENIATIYFGTETGLLVSFDPDSGKAAAGGEIYYEFRQSDWYTTGRQTEEPFFTKVYQDNYGRGLTITCVAPVRDSSGQFRGSIGIDILVHDLNQSMVNDNIVDPNYAILIDNEGYMIASKDMDSQASGTTTIYDDGIDTPVREVAETIFSNQEGICAVGEGNSATYISYSEISLTNWKLCIMSPVENIIQPAILIRNDINTNTNLVAETVNDSIHQIINSCLVLFAVIILIITYFVGKLSERITTPLEHLEKDVLAISQGNFEQRTQVSTNDEIGSLARAFNHMTESLQTYIVDLKDMTAKEERIASELSVAAKIQADMLPRNFSGVKRGEFDIYATMTPAKEVGGDFYDFFFVDDNHLALVIADVSGKGVPAALFMMISKTLLKSATQAGFSPKTVLEKVNNQLCENNDAEMFVTAWLGILEISTGKLTCANAGHEYPAVKRADGVFELIKDRHGFVLAGMEGARYREYTLELHSGDSLYVYTDGVTEATDARNELFGTDRMLEALNGYKGSSCKGLLEAARAGIDVFVGDAPQFDDITMLCLHLNDYASIQLSPTEDSIPQAAHFVEEWLEKGAVPTKLSAKLLVAVDEVYCNIVRYSGASQAKIEVSRTDRQITMIFADNGKPYNPLEREDPDVTLPLEERDIGGLGVFIVRKIVDETSYIRQDGKNIFTLRLTLT